ncbi:MAG: leucyl aminopeptidase family protein [Acidobacteriota bacterium]|nr:leucyl aminopeptidase family protein [Acidobacteriota bacterium]
MYFLTDRCPDNAVALIPVDKDGLEAWCKKADAFHVNLVETMEFTAGFGKTLRVPEPSGKLKCVLLGMQEPPDDPRNTVHLFATLAKSLPANHTFKLSSMEGFDTEQAAMGWCLGGYAFERYVKKSEKPRPTLCIEDSKLTAFAARAADAVYLARNLINTPAGDMGPDEMETHIEEIAREFGARLEVIRGSKLEQDFPAIHAVGKGSTRAPRLMDLRWGKSGHPKVTLVGKGVVFDTGGLDLKNAAGMLLMKKDMGGGAITTALARLIMASKLPVNLRLLVPCVENAVGPNAYRPGDVVKTREGKTVEIGNTDAEGRVILCDALTYALEDEPELLIDMATLTGAARVALGQDLPGFWTPSDEIAADLDRAGQQVADPVWRMPLWLPYVKKLKSNVAELNNISKGGMAGSITAALYLHEFVRPFKAWIHMDVYGWRQDAVPGSPKGGEATALRAVYRFLTNRYGK